MPDAIAPTSVCLRSGVTAGCPGVLIPAFTHHLAGWPSAGLLSVALGLAPSLRAARPALLFRRVGLPEAVASEGVGKFLWPSCDDQRHLELTPPLAPGLSAANRRPGGQTTRPESLLALEPFA